MSLLAAMPLILVTVLAGGAAVYWCVVLYRVARTARIVPTLREGLRARDEGRWPSICVVIPAHNEEVHIARSARSLAQQDYRGELRIIYVLDRCTDGTRAALDAVLEEEGAHERFTIIENSSCPPGWAGKVHAVHRGVMDAPGARGSDLLLFADADCWFETGALRASVAMLARRQASMLSLLPTLTQDAWWEKIAQPAAGMELVRQFPLDMVNKRESPRRFANGQFMLFRRDFYEELGGHAAVKNALLEDLAFARRARAIVGYEQHIAVLLADGLVRCRMYESLKEFRKGWKRIYAESAYSRADRLSRDSVRLLITGILMPLCALACLLLSIVPIQLSDRNLALAMQMVGWASTLVVIVSLARIYLTQKLSPMWAACYPLGAWIVAGVLREAARDARNNAPTEWAGMIYERDGVEVEESAETTP